MAFIHGKDTFFSIDGNDLSAYTSTSELGQTADSHEVTGYGKSSKVRISGLKDSSFSCSGSYDDGASSPGEILEPLIGGAAVPLIRQAEGAGTGKPQHSVSVVITNYVETNPVDGVITWAAEFDGSDDVTKTTQP